MSHRAILSTRAAQELANLPVQLRNTVHIELERLCEAPTTLSRRSVTPPYPPGYQLFTFDAVVAVEVHYFSILFKYGQDEKSLFVHGIGHMKRRAE